MEQETYCLLFVIQLAQPHAQPPFFLIYFVTVNLHLTALHFRTILHHIVLLFLDKKWKNDPTISFSVYMSWLKMLVNFFQPFNNIFDYKFCYTVHNLTTEQFSNNLGTTKMCLMSM